MKLIAWARIYINKPSEGGIPYAFRGRLETPAIFHDDPKNAWSIVLVFDAVTTPGGSVECPVTLLADDRIHELLVVGNRFEFFPPNYKGGTGEIISVNKVSDEEMREVFKLDVWSGTTHIIRESDKE